MRDFLEDLHVGAALAWRLRELALALTAAIAIMIPAMRATRVDPVVALRDE